MSEKEDYTLLKCDQIKILDEYEKLIEEDESFLPFLQTMKDKIDAILARQDKED